MRRDRVRSLGGGSVAGIVVDLALRRDYAILSSRSECLNHALPFQNPH